MPRKKSHPARADMADSVKDDNAGIWVESLHAPRSLQRDSAENAEKPIRSDFHEHLPQQIMLEARPARMAIEKSIVGLTMASLPLSVVPALSSAAIDQARNAATQFQMPVHSFRKVPSASNTCIRLFSRSPT
jgi:hypothetical protein